MLKYTSCTLFIIKSTFQALCHHQIRLITSQQELMTKSADSQGAIRNSSLIKNGRRLSGIAPVDAAVLCSSFKQLCVNKTLVFDLVRLIVDNNECNCLLDYPFFASTMFKIQRRKNFAEKTSQKCTRQAKHGVNKSRLN